MRCPYCGGLNSDQAAFCARCGKDIVIRPVGRSLPPMQPQAPSRPQALPPTQRPAAPQRQVYPPQSRPPVPPTSQRAPVRHPLETLVDQFANVTEVAPVGPEAPAIFPPHTVEQLHALETGALEYTQIGEDTAPGGKKIVRILFARCIHWQQVATLLKACKTLQSRAFPILIIQGVYNQEANIYAFNNGQLLFERGVRLGSQILNRYQIETGTGFEGEAVRIVLTEENKEK